MRHKGRWLALLALLVLVFSLPFLLNLDLFRSHVHSALERQLGREVNFQSLTARLLPWPGLVGRRAVVYDREGFGPEPFLYAEEIRCNLALGSLLSGRLRFAEIQLVRPSLNLVHQKDLGWNLAAFLSQDLPANSGQGSPAGEQASLPTVTASEGRINLKRDVDKLELAVRSVRLRLEPQAAGRWRIQLEGSPFRTDRPLRPVGVLHLSGEIGPGTSFSEAPFLFQFRFERGSLAQLWAAALGEEPVVQGSASLAADLVGTPADWRAQGSLLLDNLRRWDMVAPARTPRWRGDFRLKVLERGSSIEVEQFRLRGGRTEVQVAGRLESLRAPDTWDLHLTSAELVLDELLAQWAALQTGVPEEAKIEGVARLDLALRGGLPAWEGSLGAPTPLALRLPELAAPVGIAGLELRLRRGRLELAPTSVRFGDENALTVTGQVELSTEGLPYSVRWESDGVRLESLQQAAGIAGADLFGADRLEGLAEMELDWRGKVLGEENQSWRGEVRLLEADYRAPELNQPLRLTETTLRWRDGTLEIRPLSVRLGEDAIRGVLRRPREGARWEVTLESDRLELGGLGDLLDPSRRSLLERLVRLRAVQDPRWERLSAAGQVRVRELQAGPFRLEGVEAGGELSGGQLSLTRLRWSSYRGRFEGSLQADFRSSPPRYQLLGNLKQARLAALLRDTSNLADYFDGLAGADLTLETRGTGPRELLRNLSGRVVGVLHDGEIAHINLVDVMIEAAGEAPGEGSPATGTPLQSLAGEFVVQDERVTFEGARMITPRASLELSGSVGFGGQVDLLVEGRPLRVAGRQPAPPIREALSQPYQIRGTLQEPAVVPVEAKAAVP